MLFKICPSNATKMILTSWISVASREAQTHCVSLNDSIKLVDYETIEKANRVNLVEIGELGL